MDIPHYETALIVGAGEGLSASLARLLAKQGLRVALAARSPAKLAALCEETGAKAFACDATDAADVARLFVDVEQQIGQLDVAVYNANNDLLDQASRKGHVVDITPDQQPQLVAERVALVDFSIDLVIVVFAIYGNLCYSLLFVDGDPYFHCRTDGQVFHLFLFYFTEFVFTLVV